MGWAMAESGRAARRRSRERQSGPGDDSTASTCGVTLSPPPPSTPLTSSQNHCSRSSPGGGKVRRGNSRQPLGGRVGGCPAVKFRAKVSSGDYLGASIILASVYLSISSRLCCRELTRLSVIISAWGGWGEPRHPRKSSPHFPAGSPPPCPGHPQGHGSGGWIHLHGRGAVRHRRAGSQEAELRGGIQKGQRADPTEVARAERGHSAVGRGPRRVARSWLPVTTCLAKSKVCLALAHHPHDLAREARGPDLRARWGYLTLRRSLGKRGVRRPLPQARRWGGVPSHPQPSAGLGPDCRG